MSGEITGAVPVPSGQFIGGTAMPPMYSQGYGVPPPAQVNIEGSGGHPSPGAGLLSGFAAGENLAGHAIANYRGGKQYAEDQALKKSASLKSYHDAGGDINNLSDKNNPNSPDNPVYGHTDFLSSLGHGLAHVGSAIGSYFGGGAKSPTGIPPAAAAPASPAVPAPQPAPAPPPMLAAPTGPNVAPPMPGVNSVPGLEGGGPMPDTTGGAPNPGAAAVSGAQAGQAVAGNAVAAARGNVQYGQDQNARQAAAQAVSGAMDAFAGHLQDGALNDKGVPNGKAGIPPGGDAAAAAQANPAAKAGIPEDQPKGAHSLSPDYWDKSDELMRNAVTAAAAAGHDPNQVGNALNAMRTSYIQSHALRALQSANAALLNGDDKSLEQSLRNMNYYLPDGKDLTVQKDDNGKLIYQDPIFPFTNDKGETSYTPKDGFKPNMIPVDAAHLKMLGENMIDPMKVQDSILGARAAVAQQQVEHMKAGAAVTAAQGTLARGLGIQAEGEAKLKEVASTNIKNLSESQWYQARAALDNYAMDRWKVSIKDQRIDPSVLKGAQQAAGAVDDVLLGTKVAAPVNDAQGNPSLSPAAGKVVHDPNTVPKEYQGINALEAGEIRATAGDLYLAQGGRMSAQQAAQAALQMHAAKGKTHKGPGGQDYPDAYIHRETGEAGIYDKKTGKYTRFHIPPQSAQAMLDGGGQMPEDKFITAALSSGGPPGAIPSQGNQQSLDSQHPEDNNAGAGPNP